MAGTDSASPRRIETDHLGQLIEAPPPEGGPPDFFRGEERLLGRSARARKKRLWEAVGPVVERLLEPGEHVLYLLESYQKISLIRALGLGWLGPKYHQVALVLTDRKLVEVLLDFSGRSPESRIRSVPWNAAASVSLSMGRLSLRPAQGKKLLWSVRRRGDRKVLKRLLPRIDERLQGAAPAEAGPLPRLHCPGCARAPHDSSAPCPSCGGLTRSRGLAAALSLAFPGAGLLYLGHRVLGAFDMIGEVFLFGLAVLGLAAAPDPASQWAMAGTALFLLALTKVESLHVGDILVERRRPETAERREAWRRRLYAGSTASVVAVAAALAVAGSMVETVDRDLDFSRAEAGWSGTRDPEEILDYGDDPAVRSQWTSEEGWIVTVFAYPLGPGEDLGAWHEGFASTDGYAGGTRPAMVAGMEPSVEGFVAEQDLAGAGGRPLHFIHYLVRDPVGEDVHQLVIGSVPAEVDEARRALQELLSHASWIDAAR